MSYKVMLKNMGYESPEQRDAAARKYINNFVVGEADYKLVREGKYVFIDGENTSFRVSTRWSMLHPYNEYRFRRVKNFTIHDSLIDSLKGFPEIINGDLRLENVYGIFSDEEKAEWLPDKVCGNVIIKDCPYIGENDFYDYSSVDGIIIDDKNPKYATTEKSDEEELGIITEEEQKVLNYAKTVGFSEHEMHHLFCSLYNYH